MTDTLIEVTLTQDALSPKKLHVVCCSIQHGFAGVIPTFCGIIDIGEVSPDKADDVICPDCLRELEDFSTLCPSGNNLCKLGYC